MFHQKLFFLIPLIFGSLFVSHKNQFTNTHDFTIYHTRSLITQIKKLVHFITQAFFLICVIHSKTNRWYKVPPFFWFESVTVTSLSVLTKMLKNGNYEKEAHWRSFLWGRSRTRRSRSRFMSLFFSDQLQAFSPKC